MSEEKKQLSPEELEQVAGGIEVARWYYTVVTNDKLYAVLLNDKGGAIQRVSGGTKAVSTGNRKSGILYDKPCTLWYVKLLDNGKWGWMSEDELHFEYVRMEEF